MNKIAITTSIIIPVYNDNKGLKECLESIRNQTIDLNSIEAIVVDNASDTSPEEIVESFSFAKYTYEKKPGSYAARNKGMSIAQGKYWVFLDADCIPAPDWLENGIQTLERNAPKSLIGGDILFTLSDTPTVTERYQYLVGFQQKENIEDKFFSATANLFTTQEHALEIGLFEERLLSGGDRNWCWRAVELGAQVIYCPKAVVKTKPRRLFKSAIKQARRVAGGRFHSQTLGLYKNTLVQQRQKPHRSNWQSILWIFQQPSLSYIQRVQVFFIASLLKGVAIIERWRLLIGTKAERS